MWNLYSLTKSQDAIRGITRAMLDNTGNLPSLPGIFPDYESSIIRTAEDGERELVKARWGMPWPDFASRVKGRQGRDEHPQHLKPALATMTRPVDALPRPVHVLLRGR